MKNIFKKSIILLSLLLVFGACDDNEFIELNPNANTVLSSDASSIVITEDLALDNVLNLSWTDPEFGFDAAATYNVLMDFAGGDFTAPQIVNVGSELSKTFLGQELNGKLLSLGVVPEEATNIDFKIKVTLSDSQEMFSEPITINVTAFSSLLDLSTNLGVVGSATPGGWGTENIPDLPFFTTDTPDVYVAYVTLKDGFIKFRKDNLWTENFGDDGNDGTLEASGADIPVDAGTYKITVNMADLTWSMEEYSWGLVGDFTGWSPPDFKLTYNSYNNDWRTVVTFTAETEGNVKFRFNESWDLNYGDDGVDGTLDLGGADIAVTAGHYLVILDLINLEYSLEPMDVWGLVGSATPNGWDGPDTKFIPDFGINEGTYYINGITLIDGFIKVRQNDAWGVNYGDDGNDGLLESGGADIPVTPGTYNIKVNFAEVTPTIALYAWPE